jgi:hypothetical protein
MLIYILCKVVSTDLIYSLLIIHHEFHVVHRRFVLTSSPIIIRYCLQNHMSKTTIPILRILLTKTRLRMNRAKYGPASCSARQIDRSGSHGVQGQGAPGRELMYCRQSWIILERSWRTTLLRPSKRFQSISEAFHLTGL